MYKRQVIPYLRILNGRWRLSQCLIPTLSSLRLRPFGSVINTCALLVSTQDRKSTRLNSSHTVISYAVFCNMVLRQKKNGIYSQMCIRDSPFSDKKANIGARVQIWSCEVNGEKHGSCLLYTSVLHYNLSWLRCKYRH